MFNEELAYSAAGVAGVSVNGISTEATGATTGAATGAATFLEAFFFLGATFLAAGATFFASFFLLFFAMMVSI